ncbi:MAG: hypothetical protein NC201_00180 [Prevotella sp.]|nr:hypothetical protein [Bacteroides sp.]MCM1365645.1 hypothetical protein [Prevotella sp.]
MENSFKFLTFATMKIGYLLLISVIFTFFISCGSPLDESSDKINALNKHLEQQNKRIEMQQSEIESLRDSISLMHNNLERCDTHAKHAQTDVRQAKSWAIQNGYGQTLAPYIDNVLYDLEAIQQYSKL